MMRKKETGNNTLVFEIGGLNELISEMKALISELRNAKKNPGTIASDGGHTTKKTSRRGLMNVEEAATKLKLSKQSMYNLIKNNLITFDRQSPRKIMFSMEDLKNYQESKKGTGKKRGRKPKKK